MKRLIAILLFIVISVNGLCVTYYVNPLTGNDANSAVQAQNPATPWKTIQKAWTAVVAGDIIMLRGGTYLGVSQINLAGKTGTAANRIIMQNFPGEVPVLDYTLTADHNGKTGIQLNNSSFVTIKGLRITGIIQYSTAYSYGMIISHCNNVTIENCTFDHIGGDGFAIDQSANNLILNCDAFCNADPLSSIPFDGSNGFSITAQVPGTSGGNIFRGCRSWWNSDDGFDSFKTMDFVTYDSCWSFRNGYACGNFTARGNGDGFKMGQAVTLQTANLRRYQRCLSFDNRFMGFDQNFTGPTLMFPGTFYNNTAFRNVNLGFFLSLPANYIVANNVAFQNNASGQQAQTGTGTTLNTNSWQAGFTVIAADFITLDTTGVSGPRQANGTLPILNFMHLATGSDLIDRGTNVGLPFSGTAPDLGAFETTGGVTPPPTLTASTSFVNVLCNGGTTTVTVSGNGGVPPYTGTGAFTRAAGSFTFTITDQVGTTASTTITITQPTAITATQSSTAILINGGTSTTTVTASGGSGTLQYQRDGGTFQTSNVFAGVPAGNHTIIVRDANNCTRTITYTITQPTALLVSAAATVNPLLCFGNTTSITVTASGGTAPYQYRINGGALQASNVFTLRGAGTYTLTVQDAGGAIQSTSLTITQPTQITITQSSTAILVNGGTSTTTVTASGGTGAKQYSRDGGAFQGSNVFTGVLAGTHTITVRDANNCTNTLTYTLTQPSSLLVSAAATVNPLLCFGNTTTITVTVTGATPPYQYSINGGAFQNPNTFTGRGAGTYTLTVRDAALVTQTTSLTITQPTAITITESHTAIAINGGTSTVTITASGGTGTKNYAIDGGSFQASNVFAGILAGNHVIQVRDANLCINTLTTTITQPTALIVSASAGTIACNAGTTTATVTASGGTPPYQYRVGAGTLQSSNLFTVTAGTYVFTVVDAAGATVSSASVTITQPTAISINVTSGASAPTTVTVTSAGGVGTLNYSLDGSSFQASNTFTLVAAGNHTARTRDANGCIVSKSFTVGASLGITAAANAILCNGGTAQVTIGATGGTPPYTGTGIYSQSVGTITYTVTDNSGHVHDTTIVLTQPSAIAASVATGTIIVNGGSTTVTVTASGGVGTLNYKLDGGSFQSSNSFSGVLAGNHVITVRDGNGCTTTRNFTLSQPGILQITATPGAIACYGQTSAVVVTASGGTPPYTGTGTLATLAGTTTFTVTDAFGAVKDTIITIPQPAQIVVSVVTGTIAVNGGNTTATVSGVGGTGGYTYHLDGGSFQGSGSFTGVLAGSHTAVIKDANNCTNFNTFTISQPSELVIGIAVAGSLSCYNDSTNVTVSGSGGTLPYTGTGVQNKHTGTYTFSISDAAGATADTIITITQPTQITIAVATGTIAVNGGTTTATVTASGGTGTLNYSLDGGGYQLSNSFATVSAGNHTMSVKDANNCINTFSFFISQPGVVNISVSPTAILCFGGNSTVTISGSGGTAPLTVTGGSPQTKTAGTYTFTITDALGATHDTVVTIPQPDAVVIDSVNAGTIATYGGTTTIITHSTGGTRPYTFQLDGGSFQSDSTFTGVAAGNHTVITKDANSCTGTFSFTMTQPPAPTQGFYLKRRRVRHFYYQL